MKKSGIWLGIIVLAILAIGSCVVFWPAVVQFQKNAKRPIYNCTVTNSCCYEDDCYEGTCNGLATVSVLLEDGRTFNCPSSVCSSMEDCAIEYKNGTLAYCWDCSANPGMCVSFRAWYAKSNSRSNNSLIIIGLICLSGIIGSCVAIILFLRIRLKRGEYDQLP